MVLSRGGRLSQEIELEKVAPGQAGNSDVYNGPSPFTDHMIRERVSVKGQCRPLEPVEELDGLKFPLENIGVFKGLIVRLSTQLFLTAAPWH